ncbi:MAG: hypothetical protein ACI395_00115 [Candidatus Cryptobacteroides sp.]
MNYRKILLTALLPLSLSTASLAQQVASSASMPFLSINPDAVSSAMGGTYQGGAYSHFGAPAQASLLEGSFAASVSYGYFQPTMTKSHNVSASAVYKIDSRFAVTAGFLENIGKRYDVTSGSGYVIGTYLPSDMRIGAGFCWTIMENLSAGITLNYAQSSPFPRIDGDKTVQRTGFADIQVRYAPLSWLGVSVSGTNLGIPVKSASGKSYLLPMQARVSADAGKEFGAHSVRGTLDAGVYFTPAAFNGGIGAEYGYDGHYFIRLGGHYCGKEVGIPPFFSLGFGLKFAGFSFNASWNYASGPMKNTFAVGAGYSF